MSDLTKGVFGDELRKNRTPTPTSAQRTHRPSGGSDSLDDLFGGGKQEAAKKQEKGPGRMKVRTW